jgi:hypothetical protein
MPGRLSSFQTNRFCSFPIAQRIVPPLALQQSRRAREARIEYVVGVEVVWHQSASDALLETAYTQTAL